MGHGNSPISTGSLWRLPAPLSPHLVHAGSSAPGFLLGHAALGWRPFEKLYNTQPRDVLGFLLQGDFPTSIAPSNTSPGPMPEERRSLQSFLHVLH